MKGVRIRMKRQGENSEWIKKKKDYSFIHLCETQSNPELEEPSIFSKTQQNVTSIDGLYVY